MCWKYEWARAINNLEWAKIHIKRLTTRWKSEAEVYRSYHGFNKKAGACCEGAGWFWCSFGVDAFAGGC
jgi:hypothetical protein